jgi:nudix-type nucleoside diphosphatase (YffH/AdpP family)
MTDDIRIEKIEELARRWGRFDEYTVSHGLRDGSRQTVKRSIYDHGLATAILLYAPKERTIVLTRQFRLPPHLNGDGPMMVEVPAGMLDGEEPAVAARREAIEETGYDPQDLQFLFEAYASPGSVTEKTAYFLGHYTPGERVATGGGLASEGEDIEVFEVTLEEALGMIGRGEIVDAKSIILIQALALRLARGED